jgi:hypothetical protein
MWKIVKNLDSGKRWSFEPVPAVDGGFPPAYCCDLLRSNNTYGGEMKQMISMHWCARYEIAFSSVPFQSLWSSTSSLMLCVGGMIILISVIFKKN